MFSTAKDKAIRLFLLIMVFSMTTPAYCEEKMGLPENRVIELINILKEKGILTEDEAKRLVEKSVKLEEKKRGEERMDMETLLSKRAPVLRPADGLTFQPGIRVQPRYIYDEGTNNNDMMIRRTRLKAKGDAYEMVKYYLEWKIDNVGQEGKTATAKVESAFIDIPYNPSLNMRVGLYDAPFSRDALTSDSKLLLMDRSMIYDEITKVGLTDNTYGLLLYGRPYGGSVEYSFGLFDNDTYDSDTNDLMWGGRFAVNLFDKPKVGYADYQGSYIGEGKRLSIGANYERLEDITSGGATFDLSAWGIDLFGNYEALTLQAEYDRFEKEYLHQKDVEGYGWYIQGGYLLPLEYKGARFEVGLRHQHLDPDTDTSRDKKKWTTLGLNSYIRGHTLKVQVDYTFKDEEGQEIDNDTFMVQGQLDF